MREGKQKSTTFRRVKKKLPGNRVVVHYVKHKPGRARCAVTGQFLNGVPNKLPSAFRRLSKSARKPTRPYGGKLSSSAARRTIIIKMRNRLTP